MGLNFKPLMAVLICAAVPLNVRVALLLLPAVMLVPELVLPSSNVPLVAVKVALWPGATLALFTAAGKLTGAPVSAPLAVAALMTTSPSASFMGYQARKPVVPGVPSVCMAALISA